MKIEEKYKKLSSIEHVLKRPGMYIGSAEPIDTNGWIIDNGVIAYRQINYIPGLYKLFDEIIVNAYDQTIRDKTLTVIKVNFNREMNQITVYNNGIGIDVVIHPKENIYVPELIFSHLRTSTSFAVTSSETGGTYGYGAKLTAVFSTYFDVDIGDSVNHKKFNQHYKKNLLFRSKPKVSQYNKKEGYVKITFQPDLAFFRQKEISNDLVGLMERRVYDIASLVRSGVKVYINDKLIQTNTFEKYIQTFTNTQQIKNICDKANVIITKSDGIFKQLSFVNGVNTINGGKHVEFFMNRIIKGIREIIERKYKIYSSKIKTHFIKDNMWIFLSCTITDPQFSSQSKEELTTSIASDFCTIGDAFIKKIYTKLEFDVLIMQHIKRIETSEIKGLETKTTRKLLNIKKLYDANNAGTKKSAECSIIFTEGDSAKSMAISGISAIKDGNDTYGVFPLKGKLLNVREATHSQLMNNEEFKNIKQILGLQLNKEYDSENIKELRYGSIILMMDADVDGSHIKGLFINMIHYYWPSLLKIKGFIKQFITPIVKVSHKNEKMDFYNLGEYNEWKKRNLTDTNGSKWTIKYYKGLGSNTATETKEYFMNLNQHIVNFEWTPNSDKYILLAFSKTNSDKRKKWIQNYDRNAYPDYSKKQITYKNFIHKELIHFSNYDNIRSIPNIMDGLKPSQRKIMYSAFKKNITTDIKVAQFSGYIAEQTAYHHGEISLVNTTINMAQNFVGSNNINLLTPNGQFGTRIQGGKDASSARYIFTKLEEITRHIFNKHDDNILTYLDDDGFIIEPNYYVPIIPMILINGSEGIGSGYSTFIPQHNPTEVVQNLINKLNGKEFKMLFPWYNKFKGTIIKDKKNVYISKGVFTKNNNILHITELPIGTWTESYKSFADEILLNLDYIKSIRNNCTDETIDFKVKFKNKTVLENMSNSEIEKVFNLTKNIASTNMYLFDSNNKLKKYNSIIDILEEFYDIRLKYYDLRKKFLLSKLEGDISILESKMKFINLVITKKIDIFNKPKDKVISIIRENKLMPLKDEPEYDFLIKMSFYSLTKEKIDELKKILDSKNKEYNTLKNKTAKRMWLDDLESLKQML